MTESYGVVMQENVPCPMIVVTRISVLSIIKSPKNASRSIVSVKTFPSASATVSECPCVCVREREREREKEESNPGA